MAREMELRRRVERLLAGDIRPDDINRLLIWLRERTFGAQPIEEIGNLLGHPDGLNRGLTTNLARDFFVLLPFHVPGASPPDFNSLPPTFPKSLERNFSNKIDNAQIKRATGMKKNVAYRILAKALNRFLTLPDGRRAAPAPGVLSETEIKVLNCALTLVTGPAFTDADLFRDFLFALEKNKLITDSEKVALETVRQPLGVFAVWAMHHADLDLGDGSKANLYAGAYPPEGKNPYAMLYVNSIYAVPVPSTGGSQLLGTPMFTTTIKAEDVCDPALLNLPDGGLLWHQPIEITPDFKLAPI